MERIGSICRLFGIAALVLTLTSAARAVEVEYRARPVVRDILVLYDSRHEQTPQTTRVHHFAEMPLNWLGLKLIYRDINQPLPAADTLATYRGLLTWFIEPLADAAGFADWLDTATAAGLRYAFLSEMAPPEPPDAEAALARVLGRLGLKPTHQFVSVTHRVKIAKNDAAMVGFERPIDKALPDFRVLLAVPDKTTVHLSADVPVPGGKPIEAALVTTNAAGGYASDEFTIYFEPATDKVRWTLNPFRFFQSVFGIERFPIPDPTTASGRRVYFSHIDGDGWNNVSEIEGYREKQISSSEVVRREAVVPFPDLPVTIGLIAGDTMPEIGGSLTASDIAKKLYVLPQVEVASHTFTHPFDWSFYEIYDRTAEEALIDKAVLPQRSVVDRVRSLFFSAAGGPAITAARNKYIAGGNDLPRQYLRAPFNLQKEVQGALHIAESFAPGGKEAKLYLWSGDTLPFEAAVKATRDAGVRNMNGGDSRLDAEYPSVFYVPPISRPVGAERQIYAGNSNENTYTNDWLGPYYGFFELEETLKNTEHPRRLKPFNLYYHMYSGEKPAALAAVKHFLNLARTSAVTPIPASDYAAMADDFFSVAMESQGPLTWLITNRGAIETLRIDDAASLKLDARQSRGVLGAKRQGDQLYVALDSAIETARLVLKTLKEEDPAAEPAAPDTALPPLLIESRWRFRALAPERCGFSVGAQGYGPGDMIWQVQPFQTYRVDARRDGATLFSGAVVAGADGVLTLKVDADAKAPLTLVFAEETCAS